MCVCGSSSYANQRLYYQRTLMNGSIGKVVENVYDNASRHNTIRTLSLYVVVDFLNVHSIIFFYGSPTTHIIIPAIIERYDKHTSLLPLFH